MPPPQRHLSTATGGAGPNSRYAEDSFYTAERLNAVPVKFAPHAHGHTSPVTPAPEPESMRWHRAGDPAEPYLPLVGPRLGGRGANREGGDGARGGATERVNIQDLWYYSTGVSGSLPHSDHDPS